MEKCEIEKKLRSQFSSSRMLLPEQRLNISFDEVKVEFDFNQVISLSFGILGLSVTEL